ncbi:MAG TPA: DUF86 domain-containing protein [Chloroflexota bacterium]|jgi:uncharacterized protein with HEPN domain|nr:DUF86 domain-containing protein [Chloroflexota bacterium]
MRDPKERLRDILEAIAAIERYLNRGRAAFEQDELLQGWFVRHLQIIGEAARALPEEVRTMAPEIEWAKIIGMRNILVHGYFDIDLDIVWDAARRDAPALKPRIEQLLKRLEELGGGG